MKEKSRSWKNLEFLIDQRKRRELNNPELVSSGIKTDINYFDVKGYTQLHYAAKEGWLDEVKRLLAEGADPNFTWKGQVNHPALPIVLAYKQGHLGIVEHLFQFGADCSQLNVLISGSEACTSWLHVQLRQLLEKPGVASNNYSCFVYKQTSNIYKQTADHLAATQICRAVEVGNLSFLKTYDDLCEESEMDMFGDPDTPFCRGRVPASLLLLTAATYGQLDVLKYLMEEKKLGGYVHNGVSNDMLMAAVKENHINIINYLTAIDHDLNYNCRDNKGNTAIMSAVISGRITIFEQLLAIDKVDLTLTNVDGWNIFHCAAAAKKPEFMEKLLNSSHKETLCNKRDIYGYTPLEIAIENKNDLVIKLLFLERNIAEIQQMEAYGKKRIQIDQLSVRKKMYYYLICQNRQTDLFKVEEGKCGGWRFLQGYYASKGQHNYYISTLELMSNWDGTEESLYRKFDKAAPQEKYYSNLRDLFEQWINDVIWFQVTTIKDLVSHTQDDIIAQYNIVREKESVLEHIGENSDIAQSDSNFSKVEVAVRQLFKMSPGTLLFLGGDRQGTGGLMESNRQCNYYDSNFLYKVPNSEEEVVMSNIRNYKYIRFGISEGGSSPTYNFYFFKHPSIYETGKSDVQAVHSFNPSN